MTIAVNVRHEFLRLLHPTGFTDLRAIKNKKIKTQNYAVADLDGIEAFLTTYADHDLYVGVASRATENGRDLKSCLELHVVFADLDFKDSSESECRARLAALPLKPSIVINSGGGLHCYWLLVLPIDLQAHAAVAEMVLKALGQALQSDPLSAEPARILRLPGTANHKYDPPRPVIVEAFDETRRYSIDELTAVLQPPPADMAAEEDTEPFVHGLSREVRLNLARLWLANQQPLAELTTAELSEEFKFSRDALVPIEQSATSTSAYSVILYSPEPVRRLPKEHLRG